MRTLVGGSRFKKTPKKAKGMKLFRPPKAEKELERNQEHHRVMLRLRDARKGWMGECRALIRRTDTIKAGARLVRQLSG